MLLTDLNDQLKTSLKAGDKVRVETIRFLISGIRYAVIDKYGNEWEAKVNDQDVLDVIKKQVKTHKESVEAFTKANRPELVDKEQKELDILQAYLPKEISDDELKVILAPVAATGEKNFGKLMGMAMAAVAGKADGGRVSGILKSLLA
jgi:uncharacterized protein